MWSRRFPHYLLSRITGRVNSLPVLVLMPHSRCNCKCVMCDIWKANQSAQELTAEALGPHLDAMRALGVRRVMLSGGEPLMHSNLWAFCAELKKLGVRITLLSTGLLLEAHAPQVCEWCDEVIVSLDGSRDVHNRIRSVPHAYERLAEGVRALRRSKASFRVTGRCVIQRLNYFDLVNTVEAARELRLDQISFLAADVSSNAFNRPAGWPEERAAEITLSDGETKDFEMTVVRLIRSHGADIRSGFIAESEDKLRRLTSYYAALRGGREFPANRCNAPWVSAVVEADGTVKPCFFHRSFGNVHQQTLEAVLNSEEAISFRKNLNVADDPVCRRCVCTLYLTGAASL